MNILADATKEKRIHEDANVVSIAPAGANLYFRPLAGGLEITKAIRKRKNKNITTDGTRCYYKRFL